MAHLLIGVPKLEPGQSTQRFSAGTSARGHIAALDGVRGLAILLVMLYHQTVILVPDVAFDRLWLSFAHAGWIGVDLFFVLSGFLITGILLDSKSEAGYFRNFYARRVLRIFPLYYAVLFISLVIIPHIPSEKAANLGRIAGDEVYYWTYLSNYVIATRDAFRHGILDVSWSLAIEEQFYLVWPMIVLCAKRRRLIQFCVIVLMLEPVVRLAMRLSHVSPIAVNVLTPVRLDGLMVGAVIAIGLREGWLDQYAASARTLFVAAGLGAMIIIAADGNNFGWGPATQTLGYSLLALSFGALLVLARGSGRTRKVFEQPTLMVLGKYSYALYLFHLPVRALIRDQVYGPAQFLMLGGSRFPGQLVFYVVSTLAALVAAWLSWHLYERHFLALKSWFPASRRGPELGVVRDESSDR